MIEFERQIVFLFVADLERSAEFYGSTLGLPLLRDQGVCRIYRTAPHSAVGICDHRPADPGGSIITLVTDDVDGWAVRLQAAGVAVDGPRHEPAFGIRHLFLNDPDGHLLEIQAFDEPLES